MKHLIVSYQRGVDKGKLTAVEEHACVVRVYIYWGMKLCRWWDHSNGACTNKLVE